MNAGGPMTKSRRLVSGLMLALLCLACPSEESAYEPVRAPDAGRRFAEGLPAPAAEGDAQGERVEMESPVDSAEAVELREPLPPPRREPARTSVAEDEQPTDAPPPARIW